MRVRVVAALVALSFVGGLARGDGPPREALSKAQAEAWAARLRKLAPEGWTVSTRGDDLILERDRPVVFVHADINAPAATPDEAPRPENLSRGPYRLTLRFAPKMALEDYEAIAATNAENARRREDLLRESGLRYKFGEVVTTTPEEEARLKALREAEAKLPLRDLPHLYTPEHSVHLLQSWSGFARVEDRGVARECREVRESVLRYFGMYDPAAACGKVDAGRPEPSPRR